jgi:hypothetical protein
MNRKKMLIVVAAVALGIAGAVSSAQAGGKDDDGWGQGGIKTGPLGQSFGGLPAGAHLSFTTDVGRAYALDESSKAKKKKAPKTQPASTSGGAAGAASDEAARLRRYQENHY